MQDKKRLRHTYWATVLLLGALLGLTLFLSNCTSPTPMRTPTPTRTPKPTLTLTPSPTLTPTPTPTPAFPISAGCAPHLPEEICTRFQQAVTAAPTYFTWADEVTTAQTILGNADVPNAIPVGTWTYAVVAPFFTITDTITTDALLTKWRTSPATDTQNVSPLLVTTDTYRILVNLWGAPAEGASRRIRTSNMLTLATELNAWSIVPFHHLDPQWKVLRVDDVSPLEKGMTPDTYPLNIPIYWGSASRPETLPHLDVSAETFSNRNESAMTLIVMTGVTAMTRGTAQLMDSAGVTYPAKDIQHWFADADFVHISNEVSFKPDCVAEGSGTMSFCSHDSYIALLEAINTNIIELTGNHLEDKGAEWVDYSLDMYRERGWQWFGGGANQAEAAKPLTVTHGVNKIAFLGCNTVGPFAGETSGGAARCDFEQMKAEIGQLREAGFLPIVTLQYLEDYNYAPTAPQIRDFRNLASAGAVMVQGSQAHQAQTMEFYNGTFIHYGLGNFFFDQMWSDGTRQEFVDRLTFYEGRLLSIDLRTAVLEEYGRPRPMTIGDPDPAADRQKFLKMIFELRPND